MNMNDDCFEGMVSELEALGLPVKAKWLRERDAAQREALAQMKTERDQYDELHLESMALAARHEQALARVEAERDSLMDTYVALAEKLGIDLDSARKAPGKPSDVFVSYISGIQAQLAEAVTLIRDAKEVLQTVPSYGWEDRLASQLGDFLARHDQAEQQEEPHEDDERKAKPGLYCRDCGTRLMVKGVCSIYCPNKDCGDTKTEQQEAQGAKPRGGRYCRSCGTHLCVKGVCTIYCPNKNCEKDRAALATQPAAGKPIGKVELFGINMTYVEWRDRKMPPLGTELYAAPPAAAHGDEAVRKDAERYRWIAGHVGQVALAGWSDLHIDNRRIWKLPLLLSQNAYGVETSFQRAIDDAMRAQGDGGKA